MSGSQIELTIPDGLLEQLAVRTAELVRRGESQGEGDESESQWLGVKEAAMYLGCSRHRLYRLTAAKAIPFRKRLEGQGLLFRRDELDRWVEKAYSCEGPAV